MTRLPLSREPSEREEALVHAFNRYGHHDHGCEQHDLYNRERPCSCGFNEALHAALSGAVEIPTKPVRRRNVYAEALRDAGR